MLLVKTSGKTKVRQLDMSILVNQDVVRLDVTSPDVNVDHGGEEWPSIPMDETQRMDSFYGQYTLGDVESRHIL